MSPVRSQRGIRGAVVVHEDGTTYNVGAVEDPLGLVANIQALVSCVVIVTIVTLIAFICVGASRG